ncbi:MAG: hypothetical protein ING59_03955 [Burkholderiales bacterium]|nr:hypothetical protein [Burkholderiales bacterium]
MALGTNAQQIGLLATIPRTARCAQPPTPGLIEFAPEAPRTTDNPSSSGGRCGTISPSFGNRVDHMGRWAWRVPEVIQPKNRS